MRYMSGSVNTNGSGLWNKKEKRECVPDAGYLTVYKKKNEKTESTAEREPRIPREE